MTMPCYDHDPSLLHPIGFFLSILDGADDVTERGIDVYERASTLAKLSGLRDFDPWLRDATMDAATRALKKKQILDVLRILGHMDGELTTTAQQLVVKELWHGGATDRFMSTLGELYTLRQVQRDGMAAVAAAAMGKDASHGFLYLVQVPHVKGYRRIYDGVVIARRPGDLPGMLRTDIDFDIVMRIETKWYLDASSNIASDAVRDQMVSDLIQSIQRDLDFRDLFYGLPAEAPHNLVPTQDLLREVFDLDVADILFTNGYRKPTIDGYRLALEDHIATGKMVFLVTDAAD